MSNTDQSTTPEGTFAAPSGSKSVLQNAVIISVREQADRLAKIKRTTKRHRPFNCIPNTEITYGTPEEKHDNK